MKKTIIFIAMVLLLISVTSSQLQLSNEDKLKNYADTTFKDDINYKSLSVEGYEESGELMITYLKIDGRDVRWITSNKNFNKITNVK